MDCSVLVAILNDYHGEFSICRYKNMDKTLSYLQSDRNINAHINGNESVDELFLWACGALYNISRVIDDVLNNRSSYSIDEKSSFAHINQKRIQTLQRAIVGDYQEEIKPLIIFENDVDRIRKSWEPDNEFISSRIHYEELFGRNEYFYQFIRMCADEEIFLACFEMADLYFFGNGIGERLSITDENIKAPIGAPVKDYKQAIYYYEIGYIRAKKWNNVEELMKRKGIKFRKRMIRYISLWHNGFHTNLSDEEIKNLLRIITDDIERKGFKIVEIKENNYTFFEIIKI